jgi:protein TonB
MSPAHFEYREAGRGRERMRTALLMAAVVLFLALLALGGWQLAKNAGAPKKRVVQQISLVKPPLPPKPPPEPEKPKEQVKEQIKQPEPEPKEAAPAPQQDLGLDAKGTGAGDNFGLVGRPGGRDITTIGADTGNGTGGRVNTAFYASQLQSQIQDELNRDDKLRAAEYRALVELWLSPQGKVTRVELSGSTGDAELDRRLREALEDSKRLRPPPEGVALPIRVELVARR